MPPTSYAVKLVKYGCKMICKLICMHFVLILATPVQNHNSLSAAETRDRKRQPLQKKLARHCRDDVSCQSELHIATLDEATWLSSERGH